MSRIIRKIAGVRLAVAIQVFTTLLILVVGYFVIERRLVPLAQSNYPIPVYKLRSSIREIRIEVLVIAFIAFVSGSVLAYTIHREIKRLTNRIESFARGEIDRRSGPKAYSEFIPLEGAIEKLSDTLNKFLEQTITDAVILLNEDGTVQAYNPTAEYLFGYESDEVIGIHISRLFPRISANTEFYEMVEGDDSSAASRRNQLQGTIRTKAGELVSVRVGHLLIREGDSRRMGIVVGVFDVSEFKRIKEELERAEQLSMLGVLTAGLAHEIKNPLGSIKGLAQLLSEEAKNIQDSKQEGYLSTILREVDRLDSMVRRFLEFAHPSEFRYVDSDINILVRDTLLMMKSEFEKKGLKIEESYQEGLPRVEVELSRFKQALINVLTNALEASPANGTITVATRQEDSKVAISIHNQGSPIPHAEAARIFDPFYTTKDEGTGLGLTIAQKVMRDHKGHIEVRDPGGEGVVFDLVLPGKLPAA